MDQKQGICFVLHLLIRRENLHEFIVEDLEVDDGFGKEFCVMAFPLNMVGNILHIRESLWLYKAITFRYDILWLKGSESTLKYFTINYVNLSGGASYARALERESPP
ncbi:hypothetical protein D8674_005479 [Pyrus ussuriensis x Pyrus communis]|uniref:Uncharacterized protein n=1 Tax=Pyrus ussuriensis x Pyrus communis TaxID=2448454 RepID=A0A5N5FX87_9ROSA|nr:hypothetical protein D8674_005479 [Pyrus ussuriensis x Pyrus communis]